MPSAASDDPWGTRTETTVLFLAANPVKIPLLQLGEECRAIENKIRAAKFREKLRFRSRWAARPDDLLQALHEDDPAVLHFSGHGAGTQGLCFLAEDGGVLRVNSDGLGQVIRAAGDSIQLVVLNACYTKVQAEALVAHVPCVIGTPSTIGDKAAIVYAAELYRALAFGKSVAIAHQCGLAALALHSMVGDMRDIDMGDIEMAEAALRTAPPELLVRAGVDAGHVHIVQGALSARAVPAPSGESRIHLEIDIDADFETLDARTLSKLMSEICRLSGGRPVRILCVTKGSIRLYLSFEPDAARALLSLRDSGRLNRIGGFLVSNVVDLGQVESSPQALEHTDVPQPPSDPPNEVVRPSIYDLIERSPDIGTAGEIGAVIAAGQRITRARLADEVRAVLSDSARGLLGAERCSIIDRAEGEADAPLVSAALRTGHPVVWPADDATILPPASGPPEVRCALCAPIPVSGRLVAVLYATHSAEAAFGDDARAIAALLVGLAGAALDSVAVRSRSEELDRRVQAQAAELAAAQYALDDGRRQLTALREQLLHAGRMATVGTLFAGLTHELNNPLSVIVGNVDNLRTLAPAGEPIVRVIDAIDRQASRATRLVSALLRFSRAGSGVAEEVPPDELIRLVVDLLAADARRREIALRVTVADGLNPLFVVRHEIESALVNITTNALQATPEGGVVELLVFAESRDAVPGVRFVARDTGVGIAPEILSQIFNPFFTTKPEGEGTGLGLSLAREIASSHGGQLAVESVVGHGTTMSLWLPERVSPARPRRTSTS